VDATCNTNFTFTQLCIFSKQFICAFLTILGKNNSYFSINRLVFVIKFSFLREAGNEFLIVL